jgi:hypothetical protein
LNDAICCNDTGPDPWAGDVLTGLEPDAPIVLLGTELTMVDMTISLLDQQHQWSISALSRRGVVPKLSRSAAGAGTGPLSEDGLGDVANLEDLDKLYAGAGASERTYNCTTEFKVNVTPGGFSPSRTVLSSTNR